MISDGNPVCTSNCNFWATVYVPTILLGVVKISGLDPMRIQVYTNDFWGGVVSRKFDIPVLVQGSGHEFVWPSGWMGGGWIDQVAGEKNYP